MKETNNDRSEEPQPRCPQNSPRKKGFLCAKQGCGFGFAQLPVVRHPSSPVPTAKVELTWGPGGATAKEETAV